MELDRKDLAKRLPNYIRGQVSLQNHIDKYLFRGEIREILVEQGLLKVRLAWAAKGEGFPSSQMRWVKDGTLIYNRSLEHYTASITPDRRIELQAPYFHETITLFLPNGSRLDPSKIKGLEAIAGTKAPKQVPPSRSAQT